MSVDTCRICQKDLTAERSRLYCREHFFMIPTKDRIGLYAMIGKGQDMESKLLRCDRLIRERIAKNSA